MYAMTRVRKNEEYGMKMYLLNGRQVSPLDSSYPLMPAPQEEESVIDGKKGSHMDDSRASRVIAMPSSVDVRPKEELWERDVYAWMVLK